MLGASNVAMGLGAIVSAARCLGSPQGPLGSEKAHGRDSFREKRGTTASEEDLGLDVWVAGGHGRSYGTRSRVLVRTLPSILESPIWPRLEAAETGSLPLYAIVADVGNDIGFGTLPDTLLGWVEECLDRLDAAHASIAVVLPPLASLGALPRWRFLLLRSILFPRSRLEHATVVTRLGAVEEGLRRRVAERQLAVVEPPAGWFGFDAIHVRPRARRAAWGTILGAVLPGGGTHVPAFSGWRALRFQLLAPERRWWLGAEWGRPAPQWRGGGVELSLF